MLKNFLYMVMLCNSLSCLAAGVDTAEWQARFNTWVVHKEFALYQRYGYDAAIIHELQDVLRNQDSTDEQKLEAYNFMCIQRAYPLVASLADAKMEWALDEQTGAGVRCTCRATLLFSALNVGAAAVAVIFGL